MDFEFTLPKNGFYGKLFKPVRDAFPGKALILFTGGDGEFDAACMGAQFFADNGLTVMAIAYFKVPGLPASLAAMPMESLERAALYLQGAGYKKVGAWGISMGAELALLAGVYMPELISCVIAASPISFITQGVSPKMEVLPCSAFTWHGENLPYLPYGVKKITLGMILSSWVRRGDPGFYTAYAALMDKVDERTVIPVEKIDGPILMFSGQLDSMWPSCQAADFLMKRLDEKGFAYPHQHVSYEFGSHYMVPMHLKEERMFRSERRHKAESVAYKKDQLEKTLAFLRAW